MNAEAAVEALVNEHYSWAICFALSLPYAVSTPEEKRSAGAEGLWNAAKRWVEMEERPGDFRGYAGTTIKRAIIDEWRRTYGRTERAHKRARIHERSLDAMTGEETHTKRSPGWVPPPLRLEDPGFPRVDLSRDLELALPRFTELEQRIMGWLMAGWRKIEIANELGVSDGRVSQLLRPIRAKLTRVGLSPERPDQ